RFGEPWPRCLAVAAAASAAGNARRAGQSWPRSVTSRRMSTRTVGLITTGVVFALAAGGARMITKNRQEQTQTQPHPQTQPQTQSQPQTAVVPPSTEPAAKNSN